MACQTLPGRFCFGTVSPGVFPDANLEIKRPRIRAMRAEPAPSREVKAQQSVKNSCVNSFAFRGSELGCLKKSLRRGRGSAGTRLEKASLRRLRVDAEAFWSYCTGNTLTRFLQKCGFAGRVPSSAFPAKFAACLSSWKRRCTMNYDLCAPGGFTPTGLRQDVRIRMFAAVHD